MMNQNGNDLIREPAETSQARDRRDPHIIILVIKRRQNNCESAIFSRAELYQRTGSAESHVWRRIIEQQK